MNKLTNSEKSKVKPSTSTEKKEVEIDDNHMNNLFSQYENQSKQKPLFNPEDWFKN